MSYQPFNRALAPMAATLPAVIVWLIILSDDRKRIRELLPTLHGDDYHQAWKDVEWLDWAISGVSVLIGLGDFK